MITIDEIKKKQIGEKFMYFSGCLSEERSGKYVKDGKSIKGRTGYRHIITDEQKELGEVATYLYSRSTSGDTKPQNKNHTTEALKRHSGTGEFVLWQKRVKKYVFEYWAVRIKKARA